MALSLGREDPRDLVPISAKDCPRFGNSYLCLVAGCAEGWDWDSHQSQKYPITLVFLLLLSLIGWFLESLEESWNWVVMLYPISHVEKLSRLEASRRPRYWELLACYHLQEVRFLACPAGVLTFQRARFSWFAAHLLQTMTWGLGHLTQFCYEKGSVQ